MERNRYPLLLVDLSVPLEHWLAYFSVHLIPPETSSDALTEQLTSRVDPSLSLYWSAQSCMFAQDEICSASELLTL